jgi:hypothetical protein
VPRGSEKDTSLEIWVRKQQVRLVDNKMRPDNKDNEWRTHYEKLVEFRRKNGHCIVPQGYEEDISLGKWVVNQRQSHSKNKLRLDRKVLLDELEFVWRVDLSVPSCAAWNKQYEKLVEFKQKNGHCVVPCRYEEDMSFGKWVSYQRQMHIKNKIRLDQKKLLDELGFVWRVGNYAPSCAWNKQYEKLVECKQKNDHCLVPNKYKEDVALGNWVTTQRQFHSNKELRLDRTGLLKELGFAWEVSTTGGAEDNKKKHKYWHQQYGGKLLEFKQTNDNALAARSSSTTNVSCSC